MNEFEFHCKRIRNDDMRRSDWLPEAPYTEKEHKIYDSRLPAYKQAAKDRLAKFLGKEPILEHSIHAEIFLRQLFQMDIFFIEMPFCEIDYRAATIYNFRETLLTEGEEAADASSLTALRYQYERVELP